MRTITIPFKNRNTRTKSYHFLLKVEIIMSRKIDNKNELKNDHH